MAGERKFALKGRLPAAPPRYDQENEQQTRRAIELMTYEPGGGGGAGGIGGLSFLVVPVGLAGYKGVVKWVFDFELLACHLYSNLIGNVEVDIETYTHANYDPAFPGASITGTNRPTLSGGVKYEDTTLAGWTKLGLAGDIFRYRIVSVATLTQLTISLTFQRR